MTHRESDNVISELELMAYVDGELLPEDAARVAAAVERNAELASMMDHYVESRRRLVGAYGDVLDEPVPDRLVETVRNRGSGNEKVVAIRKRRPAISMGWQALAAGVVLAVGVMIGRWQTSGDGTDDVFATGMIGLESTLATALETVPSQQLTTVSGQQIRVLQSFGTASGINCREYQAGNADRGVTGVACRVSDGWRIEVQVASDPPNAAAGFRPASGVDIAAIDEVLYRLGGLPRFDQQTESCMIDNAWRNSVCVVE